MTTEPAKETRHQAQIRIDNLRLKSKITREEWDILTEDLSRNWNANGRFRPAGGEETK